MASLKYWLWLASLPGVGGVMKNRLLEHFGGPEEVYCSDSGEYFLVEGMTRAAAARLEEKSLEEADRILGDCDRLGLRILTLRDTEYPRPPAEHLRSAAGAVRPGTAAPHGR